MSSRSATVLVIFIVAVFAFCFASVFAAMTGPISILPENDDSEGIFDNLSAIEDISQDSGNDYNYQYYDDSSNDDSSDDDSSNVETTVDKSYSDDSSNSKSSSSSDSSSRDSSSSDSSSRDSSPSDSSGGGSSKGGSSSEPSGVVETIVDG